MIKTIGYAQFGPVFGDREANHATNRRMAREGNAANHLVCAPLMPSTRG